MQDNEISVVYFRAGYTPSDYDESGHAWDIRARIEASAAIKCPCIEYHLAGAKKARLDSTRAFFGFHVGVLFLFKRKKKKTLCACVCEQIQQILAQEEVLGRFSFDDPEIKLMRDSFAGLYTLSDDHLLRHARDNPKQYVLKPQREGGGNNLYDDELRQAMEDFLARKRDDRDAFILMQRILPSKNFGYFLLGGKVVEVR